jgi:hypothetical protein
MNRAVTFCAIALGIPVVTCAVVGNYISAHSVFPIALASTAAHAEMPIDLENNDLITVYRGFENEVTRESGRLRAQCTMDADQYLAAYPVPENSLEGIKEHAKVRGRRYGLCMNAAGWPSPYQADGEYDPGSVPLQMEDHILRVREKWKASGRGDLQWLEAYVAKKLASIYRPPK